MRKLELMAVEGIGELKDGEDLAGQIAQHTDLQDGDVVVIASKAVSKTEGRTVARSSVEPSPFAHTVAACTGRDPIYCELVLRESAEVVRMAPGVIITRTHHGFVMANAGVDASNTGGEEQIVLLPVDPDRSARELRQKLADHTGKQVAVIISDTFGRAWRMGQTDLAIGTAGLDPLRDYTGQGDRDGRVMKWTLPAHADELASAAELVMGKQDGIPAVIIRGYAPQGDGNAVDQIMPKERDLFR